MPVITSKVPSELSKKSLFTSGIKAGKIVKADMIPSVREPGKLVAQWLPTHRLYPQDIESLPAGLIEPLLERVRAAVEEDRKAPLDSGKFTDRPMPFGDCHMYKWIDTRVTPIDGILGLQFAGKPARIEVTTKNIYVLHQDKIQSAPTPASLQPVLQDLFRCTPNRYTPSSVSMEPATGEAEETQAAKGRRYVAGMDEAGRGSWAGPLVAAATLMDTQVPAPLFKEARDSKSFTVTKDRKDLAEKFKKETPYGVGAVTASEISGMNLDDANKLAFKRALADLVSKGHKVDALLVDGANIKFQDLHSDTTLMIRGESVSQTIAAASIIAKVRHDEIMLELSELYPEFQFDRNQGYGTGGHDRLLDLHGPSPEHRMSFKPVKDAAKKMALLGRPLMTSRTPAPPLPPPQELQF